MSSRPALIESLFVGAILLASIVPLGRGFGPYWDTWFYYDHAVRWSAWFSSWTGGEAEPLTHWRHYFPDEPRHPPLLEVGGGLTHSLFSNALGNVASVRLFVELFSVFFSVASYAFLRSRVGRGLAVVGILLYWGSPQFLVHSVLYAIDGLIAALYGLVLLSFLFWDRGWRGKVIAYIGLTVALWTKLQAFYLVPILFVWTGLVVARRPLCRGTQEPNPENGYPGYRLAKEWGSVAGIVLASFATFVFLWPALWLDFPKGIVQYLGFITKHSNVPVLYFGTLYKGDSIPPWHYPWVFTAIALPLTLILPALIRLVWILQGCVKKRCGELEPEEALLWAGALVPLMASSLPFAPKYDGVRLLLPAYGPLSILAALEIARWWKGVEGKALQDLANPVRVAALALLGLLVLTPNLRVYPFNLVYYSPLIGGTHGARERGFDLDYLGVSMHRLNPELARHTKPGDILLLAGCNALVGPRAAQEWFPVSNDIRFTTDFKSFPDLRNGVLRQMRSEGMQVFAIISSRYSDLAPKALEVLEKIPELDRVEYGGERLFSLHKLPVPFVENWN